MYEQFCEYAEEEVAEAVGSGGGVSVWGGQVMGEGGGSEGGKLGGGG